MREIIVFIVIFITVFSSGCVTLEYIPAYEQILGIDLRPFAEQNFLITPYTYSGKYTSIAVIDYKIMPEAKIKNTKGYSAYTGESYDQSIWIVDTVKTDKSLNKIFLICKEMGADALIDFKILESSDSYTNIQKPIVVKGIRITGLAIRRNDIE